MRRAVLVNGVPASGKSTIARAVAEHLRAPLLTLDTVKEALFGEFGIGDREYNRKLGRASYAVIFAVVAEFPGDATVVVDAWFGFQPLEVLRAHLRRADVSTVAEVWCHAPPDVIAARYAERAAARSAGHLGLDYVPELRELAGRAQPTRLGAVIDVDTSRTVEWNALEAAVRAALSETKEAVA